MSNDDQFRAPAGWYPDPLGLPQLRWWNNQGWTEQVSAAPEPLLVQEARFAWKEDEPPAAVPAPAPAPVATRVPPAPAPAAASSLNQLEAPRAAAKVEEPSSYTKYTQPGWDARAAATPSAPAVPPAAAAATPAPPAAAPAPPPYWDEDDQSLPEPSIRPEDLKFWPGTSPAEIRRQAREQAARAAAND